MKPDDVRKLLGGYATDTLTNEERRQLFEAALKDQNLFDTLAEEETLRELLADDTARRELLAAVRPAEAARQRPNWIFGHPFRAAAACVGVVVIAVAIARWQQPGQKFQVAEVRPPAALAGPAASEPPRALAAEPSPRARRVNTGEDQPKNEAMQAKPAERKPVEAKRADKAASADTLAQAPAVQPPTPQAAPPPPAPPAPAVAEFRAQQQPTQQAGTAGGGLQQPVQDRAQQQPARERAQQQPVRENVQIAAETTGSKAPSRRASIAMSPIMQLRDQQAGPERARLTRRLADGTETEIPAWAAIARTDLVRLYLTAPVTGQVEVSVRDGTGASRQIYLGAVSPGQAIDIPVDGPPGTRVITVSIAQEGPAQALASQTARRSFEIPFTVR